MKSGVPQLVHALLWSCGFGEDGFGEERPPSAAEAAAPPEGVDPEEFLEGLAWHKVAGRCVNRLAALPGRQGSELVSAVSALYDRELSFLDEVDHDAAWIAHQMAGHSAWDGHPAIIIKGNAASLFLTAPRTRRYTSDLDFLAHDPAGFQSIVEDLGYTGTGANFCHEAAVLDREDSVGVDLHRYFPVWRYPQVPYHEVTSGTPELRMVDWVTGGRLDYETVLKTSVPYPGINPDLVRVPGLTMTAFILCLHIFHDFVAPALCQPMAKVRLAELCELRDLCNHVDFDITYFTQLVTDHAATDAVELARRLLTEAKAPIGALALLDLPKRSSYPQEIGFGLLIDPKTPLPDLIVRSDTLGDIPDILTPADITLHTDQPAGQTISTRHTTPAAGSDTKPQVFRSTPSTRHNGHFDFDCTIAPAGQNVEFTLTAHGAPGVFFDEFVLFLGNEIIHTAYDVYCEDFRYPPTESGCTAHWNVRQDSWTVTVNIPTTLLRRHQDNTGHITAILQAGRFLETLNDSWHDFYRNSVSSACIPLRLTLNPTDH